MDPDHTDLRVDQMTSCVMEHRGSLRRLGPSSTVHIDLILLLSYTFFSNLLFLPSIFFHCHTGRQSVLVAYIARSAFGNYWGLPIRLV